MSLDENDKAKAGKLPHSSLDGAQPINDKARAQEHLKPPRLYRVKELLSDSATRSFDKSVLDRSCTTGHYKIDDITNGFEPGSVWVFGADTSWGKSSWCVSIADENIKLGRRVLIVSAEDPPSTYGDRLMVRRAQVDANRFRKKRLTPEESERVVDVANRAEDVPVYIQAGIRPIELLRGDIERIIKAEGIDMVIFDYLQEFHSSDRHQDQRNRFKHTSAVMRDVVRSSDKSGLILSQLTVFDPTKPPTKHNIRESRDVSNAAEVVALGFTPSQDVSMPGAGDDAEPLMYSGRRYILVDKNKSGPAGVRIEMDWSEECACFNTVKDPEAEYIASIQPDQSWYDN